MNIFYLDQDIEKCAQYHCDKHVVKMIIEYAQILSSVCRLKGFQIGYKLTHKNHPCVKWAMESTGNWLYLQKLAMALCREYTHRYKKIHKTQMIIACLYLPYLPYKEFSQPIQAMPDKYKSNDSIQSYRQYYINEKVRFAKWTNRQIPDWFKVEMIA